MVLKKCLKVANFLLEIENFSNSHNLNHGRSQDFLRGNTKKHNLLEILRKFPKIFLRKVQKMHYFSIFFKKFNNALIFCAFGRKTQIVGKF